ISIPLEILLFFSRKFQFRIPLIPYVDTNYMDIYLYILCLIPYSARFHIFELPCRFLSLYGIRSNQEQNRSPVQCLPPSPDCPRYSCGEESDRRDARPILPHELPGVDFSIPIPNHSDANENQRFLGFLFHHRPWESSFLDHACIGRDKS